MIVLALTASRFPIVFVHWEWEICIVKSERIFLKFVEGFPNGFVVECFDYEIEGKKTKVNQSIYRSKNLSIKSKPKYIPADVSDGTR